MPYSLYWTLRACVLGRRVRLRDTARNSYPSGGTEDVEWISCMKAAIKETAGPEKGQKGHVAGHLWNILFIDDSEDDRVLFGIAVRQADAPGLRFLRPLSGGSEAIKYLEGMGAFSDRDKYPYPDLMVLDLKMPRTTGFDVLTWMKQQLSQAKRPRVVVVSDSRMKADVEKAFGLGADAYFQKPEGLPELVDLIRGLEKRLS
jgi:CheY-like chemotaxis protein